MKAILWFFSSVILGLYIFAPVIDPDLWWHIAIGRWILAQGVVPTQEHWNQFALGQPFRAYSWSAEILFAWLDGSFGVDGLFWGKIVLGQVLAFSLFYVFSKISGDWFFGLLLGIIGVVSCHGHFTFRPQTFTWIYLAWLLFFVDRACRTEKIFPSALGVILVMSLWANMHITTLFGVAATFAWAFSRDRIALTSWLVLASIIGTLLTPYFGAEWITFFSKTGHPLEHGAISEFQPATILQFATGFVLLSGFLIGMLAHFQPKAFSLVRVMYSGGMLLGGLAIIKFLPYAAILLLAVAASGWRVAREKDWLFGNFNEAIGKLEDLFSGKRIPPEGLGFIMLCIVFVLVHQAREFSVDMNIVPDQALAYIDEKQLQPPIMHTFGYGGSVMRHLTDELGYAEHKVVIDGRTNVTPPEILQYHMDARGGSIYWRRMLDLVEPKTILWVEESPFITLALQSGEWCQVYTQKDSALRHTVLIPKPVYEDRIDEFPGAVCSIEAAIEEKELASKEAKKKKNRL